MPSNKPGYQADYIRKHYQANKGYYKQKARERNKRIASKLRAFVDRYKLFVGCVDCGYKKNAQALHLDHVRGVKFKDISRMCSEAYSIDKVKEEIRKCEVRCANCHAIVTYERRETKN